jgi:UMF1 family MFS transporter
MTPPSAVGERRSVWSWIIYDLANTIFALGVIGLYFPNWLTSLNRPDSLLASVIAVAGLIVVFVAPWAGARSDAKGTRIPTLAVTTLVAVIATGLLGINVPTSVIFLGIALVAVNIGSVVYDALLIDVSNETNRGLISGRGVGVGYFGSYLGVLIGVVTLDLLGWGYPATFRALALGFLLFALPAFFFIEERQGHTEEPMPRLIDVHRRIVTSWRLAARYPSVVRFLIGRFFYTDAINTLISGFLAIFVVQEFGWDEQDVRNLLLAAITAAIFGGLFAGRFVDRFGPKRVLRWVLLVWIVAIGSGIVAASVDQPWIGWTIGPLGGLALGATWASDRVVMTRISPPRFIGEFYGLYATVGRFATIVGPIVWALIVDVLDFGRSVAMGALAGFIVVGWWLLRGIDDGIRSWDAADLPVPTGGPVAPPR